MLAKKNYDELLELLYKGAYEFLTHGQQQSGVDLGILYIDVLVKSKTPIDKKVIENVTTLFSKIDRSIAERDTYLSNAIRWSKGDNTYSDPLLHKVSDRFVYIVSLIDINFVLVLECRLRAVEREELSGCTATFL